MLRLILFDFVLVVQFFLMTAVKCQENDNVKDDFEHNKIPEDIGLSAPSRLLEVTYESSGKAVIPGCKISPSGTVTSPTVTWEADPKLYYTVIMIDPDTLTPQAPILSQILHWIVGNIPGETPEVSNGDTIASYLLPIPTPGSAPHRYTFLLFATEEKVNFGIIIDLTDSLTNRVKFSVKEFSTKYNLGEPAFGNFFLAESDTNGVTDVLLPSGDQYRQCPDV